MTVYSIRQAKTGISSLALKCQFGVDYRTAWLMHHKLLAAMAEVDTRSPLRGDFLFEDAYLGGKKAGTSGLGSPNKVPVVAAVSLNDAGRPLRLKMTVLSGLMTEANKSWAKSKLMPGCDVRSDGLACFAGAIDAGCAHSFVAVGQC